MALGDSGWCSSAGLPCGPAESVLFPASHCPSGTPSSGASSVTAPQTPCPARPARPDNPAAAATGDPSLPLPPAPGPSPASAAAPEDGLSLTSPDVSSVRDLVVTCLQPPYCLYLRYAKSGDAAPPSPRPSHLSQESIQIHKVLTETLSTLAKPAADDVRRQIQTHMESCINAAETTTLDEMTELVQSFYTSFHERVHTHSAYFGVAPERRAELEDLAERYLTTRLYRVLFTPLSQHLEEADLAVQKQIRSLYWVGAHLLELNIDQTNPEVNELVESAITDIIEVDSKRTPQDKLSCVSSCVAHLLEMLCVGRHGEPPSADDLLPAIIFVVLRANPPRLQSNVQYVTRFSSQQRILSGQQGYDFTNLCCAVSFIESMGADSLGLTAEEYARYMSGEVLPEDWESGQYRCQALRLMDSNTETLATLQERQTKLLAGETQLGDNMDAFSETVSGSVERTLSAAPLTLRPPKRPAHIDSPADNSDLLPAPLVPIQADGVPPAPLEALAQLPEPPPGLLTRAQDSLTELLSMSHMSMDASPPVTPSELPLPPPPTAEELPPPPPPPEPEPAGEPAVVPRDRSSPPPPQVAAAVRARRPAFDSIPSIACSTGGDGPLLSEQQQDRRRLSELPRSVSIEPAAGRRRMSELPRSASHSGGPQQPRRSSLMAQEARRFSEARAEQARSRLQAEAEELSLQPASPGHSDHRYDLAEQASAQERDRRYSTREQDRRYSVREQEQDRRYSVREQEQERRASQAAVATAALQAECDAKQRRGGEKSDKLVKVLSGIFSLTDNF